MAQWLKRSYEQRLVKLNVQVDNADSRKDGGAEGIRTPDPHNAIVVLYQLSYDPIQWGGNLRLSR
jgi:hypothetical protein